MKKIMIVDDNYLSAEGIEKNIDWETLNAEIIHVCYNGTSAIEAMKKEPADLIISDIEMPDLDGISMSRQALEINPMVKIILISAYDKFEYARRALLLGALDYIEKPLDYAYLIQKVKNAFALMEKEQKNLQLLKQSRPLLTEKFFREITHLPSSEAAYRLKPYLKYLNLELNYDFYTVVILELENAPDLKAVYGIEKFLRKPLLLILCIFSRIWMAICAFWDTAAVSPTASASLPADLFPQSQMPASHWDFLSTQVLEQLSRIFGT